MFRIIVRSSPFIALALGGALLTTACGTPAADTATPARETAGATTSLSVSTKALYREVTIPAGTSLPMSLTSSVASDTSAIEDAVTAELTRAILVNGREVVPVGARVTGSVTSVADAGRVKGRGEIAMRFTTVRVAGDQYALRSALVSRQADATKGEDATKIGIGAGAGAAIGALLGGSKGAAEGAAIGGGAGTGVVLATKGKSIHLRPGDDVSTQLTAPLTIRVQIS
jgi:hypothetical protein